MFEVRREVVMNEIDFHATLCALSNAWPPLIRTPWEAPTPVPTITAVGVAKPRAHGQAMTMTEMPNCSAS